MIEKLLAFIAGAVIATISRFGYGGIVLLMSIESACIPLPSEVVLPFSGYLVFKGRLALWGVALAGAIGSVLGSWLAYGVGTWGGRPFIERYGRYLLVTPHDLDLVNRWFDRYGDMMIFVGRMLPVVRTFIAFPAGIARMPAGRFTVYTFAGSLIWCGALAWVGMTLGRQWDTLSVYFHRFDVLIAVLVVAAIALYVWRHIRSLRRM